jgi:hypothetical protein
MNFKIPLQPKQIEFRYVNWRDRVHTYVIDVESIEFGPYERGGMKSGARAVWVLSGHVVTRDGDRRPEMGDNRRRTFIMSDIAFPSVVE